MITYVLILLYYKNVCLLKFWLYVYFAGLWVWCPLHTPFPSFHTNFSVYSYASVIRCLISCKDIENLHTRNANSVV